jgi:hypothetical protein
MTKELNCTKSGRYIKITKTSIFKCFQFQRSIHYLYVFFRITNVYSQNQYKQNLTAQIEWKAEFHFALFYDKNNGD